MVSIATESSSCSTPKEPSDNKHMGLTDTYSTDSMDRFDKKIDAIEKLVNTYADQERLIASLRTELADTKAELERLKEELLEERAQRL